MFPCKNGLEFPSQDLMVVGRASCICHNKIFCLIYIKKFLSDIC
jgi:hypothetical protein